MDAAADNSSLKSYLNYLQTEICTKYLGP